MSLLAFIFEAYVNIQYWGNKTFSSSTLKILTYNILTCIAFCKKIVIFLYFILYVFFLYSLAIFSVVFTQFDYDIPWSVFIYFNLFCGQWIMVFWFSSNLVKIVNISLNIFFFYFTLIQIAQTFKCLIWDFW